MSVGNAEVQEFVLSTIREINNAFGDGLDNLEYDADLVEMGLLDSLGFVAMMSALENRFDIVLDFGEIDPESFTTVNGIVGTAVSAIENR